MMMTMICHSSDIMKAMMMTVMMMMTMMMRPRLWRHHATILDDSNHQLSNRMPIQMGKTTWTWTWSQAVLIFPSASMIPLTTKTVVHSPTPKMAVPSNCRKYYRNYRHYRLRSNHKHNPRSAHLRKATNPGIWMKW